MNSNYCPQCGAGIRIQPPGTGGHWLISYICGHEPAKNTNKSSDKKGVKK